MLHDFSQWLHATAWATALRESETIFPLLLIVHVLGLVLLIAPIFVVDLRLLGWCFREEPVLPFVQPLLRVARGGFWLLAASGVPLLAAQAGRLYTNPFLRAKFVLLALVGLNAVAFHRFVEPRLANWGRDLALPVGARVVASVSLTGWAVLVVVSRYIPLADSR